MGTRSRYISNFVVSSNDIANSTITYEDIGTVYTANIIETNNLFYDNSRVYSNVVSLLPNYTGSIGVSSLNASNITVSGLISANNIIVSGNLTVQGNTVTVNSETVLIADNFISLNSNQTGSPTENAGIEINRGSSSNVQIRWNETTDNWEFTNDGITYSSFSSASTGRSFALTKIFGG